MIQWYKYGHHAIKIIFTTFKAKGIMHQINEKDRDICIRRDF